ncbi:hypothetical protein TVAG_391070 [Trichomonas vaginalis G3]|uniref:Uncharacterized protein n=1 Tax=Trichomonas vaginalis (strain ATCC PRA-98 / G3) TaxID=412133 RepID=A2DFM0_TRIV3|nr:guanylate cyclase protein [Trichomonas vaginalis G3]EAY20723.1 hypothetical protein TVAG_391070 [Trichomonas vaginalis G3]KAI5529502.1 guanylate cyclase protein [Trichomonas vaginalis G3]|eukprot:XP_001581709.1 hypothetical protein [Trichomonas vaginalis G3]
MFSAQRLWSGRSDAEIYYLQYDVDGAELANNFWFVYRDSNYLFSNLSLAQLNKASNLKKTFRHFAYVFPPITFVILYLPPLILHFFILHSEKKLQLILKTVDINSKNEAKETLILQNKDDGIKFADNTKETAKRAALLVLKGFWGFCFFFLILASSMVSIKMTENLSKLNSWNNFACSRLSLSVESLNTILICIVIQDVPGTYPEIYHDYFLDIAKIILDKLYEIDDNLISGTDDSEACKGFDEVLDKYNIYEPYKYYKNASLHQQIDIYRSYGTKILEDMKNRSEFEVSDVVNLLFLTDYIMFDRLLTVTERYFELCSLEYTKMWQNFVIITIFVVLCLISFFVTDLYYYHNRVSSYRGGLSIIKRINPYTLLNNKVFNQVFLKENESETTEKLTIEGSIIKGANEAIFCTNIYGIVEVTNNSVSSLLGYILLNKF